VKWGPELALLDADGDGYPNGLELQDRFGLWKPGGPAPGRASLVSRPGDPNSVPNLAARVEIQFSGMTPHQGQRLNIRAIDKENGLESARAVVPQVAGAGFKVALENLTVGHSYWIDLHADHNGNGRYDAPPADHARRANLDNVAGDTTLQFSHNTNFTSIGWKYLLTVRFSGMNPHVAQRLFLRVVDSTTNEEVRRATVRSVPGPDSTVALPGIQPGRTYHVDFFADRDGVGQYDQPPTDHAWRISGAAASGDVVVDFAHNISFTDIQ